MSHEVEEVEEPKLATHFEDTYERGVKIETAEALQVLETLDALLFTYRFTPLNPMGLRVKDFEIAQVTMPPWGVPSADKNIKLPNEEDLWVLMLRKNSRSIMCGVTLFKKSPALILLDIQKYMN